MRISLVGLAASCVVAAGCGTTCLTDACVGPGAEFAVPSLDDGDTVRVLLDGQPRQCVVQKRQCRSDDGSFQVDGSLGGGKVYLFFNQIRPDCAHAELRRAGSIIYAAAYRFTYQTTYRNGKDCPCKEEIANTMVDACE